jgi:hypothetical protein
MPMGKSQPSYQIANDQKTGHSARTKEQAYPGNNFPKACKSINFRYTAVKRRLGS